VEGAVSSVPTRKRHIFAIEATLVISARSKETEEDPLIRVQGEEMGRKWYPMDKFDAESSTQCLFSGAGEAEETGWRNPGHSMGKEQTK
jgi:hypothetical protein